VKAADHKQSNTEHRCLGVMPPAATSPAQQTQQINLNNKLRREKPDESDTKMIWINMIQRVFGPIFHGD
jgi:hypothetical protein